VTGTGFDSTAVVLMDGSPLITVVVDPQTLNATVPAGTTTGIHVITVTVIVDTVVVPLSPSFNLEITASVVATATHTPPAFGRPQLIISSYKINDLAVYTGEEFKLKIGFDNAGTFNAINAQAVFSSADVVPTNTGGVKILGSLLVGGHVDTDQTFLAANSIYGKSVVVIDVTLTYYDEKGTSYSDKFTLSVPANGGVSGESYPTSTYTEPALSFMLPPRLDDLSALRRRGAKVVMYHGTSDPIFSSEHSVQVYEAWSRGSGAPAESFARLYLVPGMNHCRGGPAADQFDLLQPLVEWVEQGKAPAAVTASVRGPGNGAGANTDLPASWSPGRTRPLCPYPAVARRSGEGDLESASAFSCR
jgi:hypothetical protein